MLRWFPQKGRSCTDVAFHPPSPVATWLRSSRAASSGLSGIVLKESGEGIWSLENNSSGGFYCWLRSDLPCTAAPPAVVCRVQAITVWSTHPWASSRHSSTSRPFGSCLSEFKRLKLVLYSTGLAPMAHSYVINLLNQFQCSSQIN
ncbi:MAG: hypothetical protein EZS28_031030 [Streblomastix strix]|uniref:Uncharacterized protein n=1 Tax=Streblomastix strix TaxID=222440 RepID=A0A5J4UTL7_9EUKA|nr:MAG: hypothetical protein EZS28_031030 [Streblomastix strix]